MLSINVDNRGKLVSMNDLIESVPFTIKRFMDISNVPNGQTRGYHAHRTNKQFLLCFSGRVVVRTVSKDEHGGLVDESHELNEGDLFLFPANMLHRSPPNMTNKIKTIISFNIDFNEVI